MEVKSIDGYNDEYIKKFKYFKRLVIENYLLTTIIVITVLFFIVFYIYRNKTDTCRINNSSSFTTMNTQEIEEYNNQFSTFAGLQKGDKLKSLCDLLIINANSSLEEKEQLPIIIINDDDELLDFIIERTDTTERVIDILTILRNSFSDNNKYNVEFDYQKNGLIDKITITGELNRNIIHGGE